MNRILLLIVSFYCLSIDAQTINGHDYVDLGLPSGTLWATANVGANSPEDYGQYFAWGETTQQKSGNTYTWGSYKWGGKTSLTKYCTSFDYGSVDNMTELESADDAATANWGTNWCMPTSTQMAEIFNTEYTTQKWTTQNGVYGALITSKRSGYTDNSVFLPAAGYCEAGSQKGDGQYGYGYYWSKSLDANNSYQASALGFQVRDIDTTSGGLRYCGFSVRAVVAKRTTSQSQTSISLPVANGQKSTEIKYIYKGQVVIDKNNDKYNFNGTEMKCH